MALFGESAWAIRLPALLFGTATIPLVYLLGREVLEERDAWASAAFLTVFYPHVWFSQSARGYTMLAFFSTLATLLLVRHLRRPREAVADGPWGGLSVGYAVAVGLGAFTHLTMVFLAVGQAAVCAFLALRGRWERARVLGLAWTFVLAAACTLLLYGPMLGPFVEVWRTDRSELVGISTPLWALLEAVRVIRRGLGAGTLAGAALAAAVFGVGALAYARRAPRALALFLVPGVVTVVGAAVSRGTMYPRFFFFMVAFLVLILIRGALLVGDEIGRRVAGGRPLAAAPGPAIVGLMIVASLFGLGYNYRYPKQDYEGAIAFVEARAEGADTIVATGEGAWPLRTFYGRDYPVVETRAELDRHRTPAGRTWMVFTFPLYVEAEEPEVMDAIDAECGDRAVFPGTIGGGDLIVCSFPPLDANG